MASFITSAIFVLTANKAGFTTWTCWAQGQLQVGPAPTPPSFQTAYGHGPTQQDAQTDAMNQCSLRGLTMCTIQGCMQP